jgi:hypothetical protein
MAEQLAGYDAWKLASPLAGEETFKAEVLLTVDLTIGFTVVEVAIRARS